jgi:hypothetical protein
MGLDLGDISIHADSHADSLARRMDAEAFTTGADIYFRAGYYDPHSKPGLHLLAHEITHTVQQSRGGVTGTQLSSSLTVSDPADNLEQEAEQSADQIMEHISGSTVRKAPSTAAVMDASRPDNRRQRQYLAKSGNSIMLQRKVFTDTSAKGWTVSFNPTAAVTPLAGGQQVSHFDGDSDGSKVHQQTFDVTPGSSGSVFVAVNMNWQGVSNTPGGGGGGAVIPGLTKEDCKKLPVPDEIKRLCEIGGTDCQTNVDNASDAILIATCTALTGLGLIPGLICFAAKTVGADKFLKNLIKQQICGGDTPGKKDGPPKPSVIATGKGSATLQLSYAVDQDGKMQLFGPGPISSSNGSGAQVISPVQFSKDATPSGGEVSLAPMIHSIIGQETNDFQQLFDVSLRLPAPPSPVDVDCKNEVFPFRVAQDRFENENVSIQKIFNWFRSLDLEVQKNIQEGKIQIRVTGRASTTGDQAFNLQLAEKRAKRVGKILQDFAGSDAHLDLFAFGKLEATEKGEVGHERRADMQAIGKLEGKSAAKLKILGEPCIGGTPFVGPGTTPTASVEVTIPTGEKAAGDVSGLPVTEESFEKAF